ncbi:bile acid:sodium symporter [Nonomuraea fuscirosea]|uniref:bile acid:sodium symporter family protein n=1 Tax=Nonomuraea fuscirosea TaxID=1291556 RepID=UPI002DDA4C35|nr:bile acid:sodium symporter [Nonomuraea fuscirosea]WSA58353.1 bile acid:sodium symporter [Nonomuraea fuscirosea]
MIRMVGTVQRRLLALMIVCYLLAAVVPRPGEVVRTVALPVLGSGGSVTVPMILLAVMLSAAGLGVRVRDLRTVLGRPLRLASGVAVNALLPVVLLPVAALCLRAWPDAAEVECLAVGLLLVLAMPIAGGAASWGQHAGGNVPLVVAMVVGSTVLSPFTVPWGLTVSAALVGPAGAGSLDDTARLDGLAGTAGAGAFALAVIVLPCLTGIIARAMLGERRAARIAPVVKLVNIVNILLLCYINASGALGRALSHPDPDFLVLAVGVAGMICCVSFLAGRWISRWTRCDTPDGISLTFATGMNNTSAAAVLAASWFAHRPQVLLPILAYSLLQKLAAGLFGTRPPAPPAAQS